MRELCEICKGTGKITAFGLFEEDIKDCIYDCCECSGKGYTKINTDGTTTIKIDYYEELKAKADKLIKKETPIKPNTSKDYYNYCPKCNGFVEDDYGRTFDYCPHCGQKLDNSNV